MPDASQAAHDQISLASFPGVSFQTVLGGTYVGAQNNGGGAVIATATVAQAWEQFTLIDTNGGGLPLQSGDTVFIQAGNGQFFQAMNGGGSTLNAGSNNQLGWETFKVVKQSGGGAVGNGDVIGLQASSGAWVSAQNGGGGPVFAYGGALGSWEQMRISGLSASPIPTPAPGPTPPAAPAPPLTPPTGSSSTVANVSFKTTLKGNFVGAENNGGGAVIATATIAQAWETFDLIDLNGGTLQSGDSVYIKTGGGQYFHAANGGGSTLDASSAAAQASETFKIIRQSGGGAVNSGDVVGLQTSAGAWVSAQNGGGGLVFAYGNAFGSWEGLVFLVGAAGSSGGGGGGAAGDGCDAPGLTWKSANKTNYESWCTTVSECVDFNGQAYGGLFSDCGDQVHSLDWVMTHNVVSVFPDAGLRLHDLCLKSGSKTIKVTVLDTCGDSDCDGCCTQNKGNASLLVDVEKFTNQRFGVADGPIQWTDLGPTKGGGCN